MTVKDVSIRKCGFESVDELMWVTSDTGAFGDETDGPLFDWLSGSKDFMSMVDKFDIVVQAGGNCGMYPRFYKNYFEQVYTFEPDETNFYCLDYNCQGDGYKKFKGGLGNTHDMLSLSNYSKQNVGMHRIINSPGNVKMFRIDDLRLDQCDLIHLDIEGYELEALKGAENTIQQFMPVIITERAGGADYLASLGYSIHKHLRMDTVFIPR